VLFPDDVVSTTRLGARQALRSALPSLAAGVTEVHLRPAVASDELTALAPDWRERVDEHDLLVGDKELRAALDEHGVRLIGYRPLRDVMRPG
jgi:hypothetical protein